jgi:hypothetical protein
MIDIYTILIYAIGSFLGSLAGSLFGCRMAWRTQFVTREEAITLARAINEQRRLLEKLESMM